MRAIDFVIRTPAGTVERGAVGGEEQGFLLQAGQGNDISLNISQADLSGYDRAANDLLITLVDGRVIVLEDYFSGDMAGAVNSRLFLSANGELNEVSFVEADGGALFAQYGPTETWGKWSPSDQLIFIDDPEVMPRVAGAGFDGEEEQVGMLAALPLLGLGGAGAGGLAALLGLPLLVPGGGNGTPSPDWVGPTVDSPDASTDISGDDPASLTISGTANPGSTVEIVVGNQTMTGTAGEDRTWTITFTGNDFPVDGAYVDIPVKVTDPNGTVTTLDGPTFNIDTVPPVIDITGGTVSVGVVVNETDHGDGVTISGTGEAGAELTITIGTTTQTTTIGGDGSWSFTFDQTVFQGGEYTREFTLRAVDGFGNATVITDSVQIDTVNTISLDNAPLTGDNLISASEHSGGVTLSGSSQAGSSVVVTIGGSSQTVTADANGGWSVVFSSTELASGTYTATAEIVSTDPAGNVSRMSHSFDVDTEQAVTINTNGVAVDGIVNAAEYGSNVTVNGTGEAGASITVTSGAVTLGTTTVGGDGTWSLSFSPTLIDGGPGHSELGYSGTLNVTSTDTAGNTSSTSGTVRVDTRTSLLGSFEDNDQVINAVERADGVVLSGSAEAGAAVVVSVAGATLNAIADANGAWNVTVPAAQVPTGVSTLTAQVTTTDLAGNSASASMSVAVDTETAVTVNTNAVEGDGTVNAAERADGVVLTGTAEANSTVVVTVNGNDYTASVAGGTWSVTLPANEIPQGETSLAVMATSTDRAGNTATATGTIDIDTETNVAVMTANVEGDGVVNNAEHADGVTLNGTAEPGASVVVTLGAVARPATVAADGSWSVTYAPAEIPTGERTLTVTARATDLAGNVETASGTLDVDTLVRNFGITSTPGGADGVINQQEAAQGLTLTGTTEPGGSVVLTLAGQTVTATVDASGNWSAFFSAASLPSGEQTVQLTAVSTDLAGNTDTINQNVVIDTDAGLLTISPAPVEGDDVVNFAEASDGVTLTGTSTPGQWVDVTMDGVTHTVLTGANGIWVANYAAGEIRSGTYDAQITAQITDSAGNTLIRTDSVHIDTEVVNFATSTNPVEGDNVINAAEAANGFTLTGTTEPGGTVTVTFNGVTHTAVVDGAGNWSVGFAASEVPSGELIGTATVNTTDVAGNTDQTSVSFGIDTYVNTLALDSGITGDDTVNAAEAAAGITLTGDVEPGSTVIVTINGVAHAATVAANGSWTVDIPSSSIPTGTMDIPVQISATDAAGNTASVTETLSIDTDAPDTLSWTGYGRSGGGVAQVWTESTADDLYLGELNNPTGVPSVSEVPLANTVVSGNDAYLFLQTPVADGTHLVLASTDDAGNTSGAYLVTDDPSTSAVQMSDNIANSLRQFNIDTIDLHFAEDSHLTITESQIEALSSTSDTVAVRGGSDDHVTITGATAQGSVREDGVDYNVFSLGNATLYIEDDITNVHGVI